MPFTLPPLPFAHDALEPFMTAETLTFHHDKHHAAYATKGAELAAAAGLSDKSLEEIIMISAKNPAQSGLFNNAAQHWNHSFFWKSLKAPKTDHDCCGHCKMDGKLEAAIKDSFGSFDDFRAKFIDAGMTQFGSGWAWLVLNAEGKLEVMKTSNADTPMVHGKTALLTMDVWEHSYYIDYRNARQKYLESCFDKLLNWDTAAELFAKGPVKRAA